MAYLHTQKQFNYYDKVIEIYQQTGYTPYRIAKLGLVPVSRHAIKDWIANFVAENGKVSPMTVMQRPQVTTPQAQSEEVENLKKRVKELEAQLRRKHPIKDDLYF